MLAAHRDQENRVLAHQAGGTSKQQFQAKTPGARYPITPLKVLSTTRMPTGHWLVKGCCRRRMVQASRALSLHWVCCTVFRVISTDLLTFYSRASHRTRSLGNKTTNAKARATQQGVKDIVREFEKTQQTVKPTTTKRTKQAAPQIESSRLEIHVDKSPLTVGEEDIEYAPPRPKELPYESDVIPNGAITFKGMKKENMFKGYYQHYFNPVDENGISLREGVAGATRASFQEG